MRLSRIHIENFRTFKHVDITVGRNIVVVGENKTGKSNLLHALRLALDPTLPESARQLRDEDFWDGLPRPLAKDVRILVEVELTGFEASDPELALLAPHLVSAEPAVARISYCLRQVDSATEPTRTEFEYVIYGGGREENRVSHELRRRLPLMVLPALRDAEGDLENWRRSPLRPLLEAASANTDPEQLVPIAADVLKATEAILKVPEIETLANSITERVEQMVGPAHGADPTLGVSPVDPSRLLRSLRLLIDSGTRTIAEASLGTANILYLVLKLLEIELSAARNEREHTIVAIEEPEAHLHPHVQRLVYGDVLRRREHKEADDAAGQRVEARTIVLTTHSPHVASVAPLESLVLLRRTKDNGTAASSAASRQWSSVERDDLERYLDVSRGEVLFSRGVLLVEGDAEEYVVPAIAFRRGYDLDRLGVSVCSVRGTNFAPYLKLLQALGVPCAVLTDRDPQLEGDDLGVARARALLGDVFAVAGVEALSEDQVVDRGATDGIFVNSHTLEVDIYNAGWKNTVCRALHDLAVGPVAQKRAEQWKTTPIDAERFLKDIQSIGKGRFAQRLATGVLRAKVKEGASVPCPKYMAEAFAFLVERVG